MAGGDYDYLIKALLVGQHKTGKSALCQRMADDTFTSNEISTIGVDFKIKTYKRGKIGAKIQLWDTAGQQRFRTITSAYYRGAAVVFLCYDTSGKAHTENATKSVSSPEEALIEDLESFKSEIDKYCNDNVIVIVVGCKNDERNNSVVQVAEDFADRHDYPHVCCSAKTGENVTSLFEEECVDEFIRRNEDRGNVCHAERPQKTAAAKLDDSDSDEDDGQTKKKKKKIQKKPKDKKSSFYPSLGRIFGKKE